ncbi:hypothetical protein H5410_064685 [Solanum commersonii]|uniref:Uncharacterized protein n=1 Tax=Solanum commersonii TaxID=4109 RepID=A0A9J5VYP0_SOLCO|nr:hypothetical protein H5410_064685 [Solanum commersonii]
MVEKIYGNLEIKDDETPSVEDCKSSIYIKARELYNTDKSMEKNILIVEPPSCRLRKISIEGGDVVLDSGGGGVPVATIIFKGVDLVPFSSTNSGRIEEARVGVTFRKPIDFRLFSPEVLLELEHNVILNEEASFQIDEKGVVRVVRGILDVPYSSLELPHLVEDIPKGVHIPFSGLRFKEVNGLKHAIGLDESTMDNIFEVWMPTLHRLKPKWPKGGVGSLVT